MKQTTPTLAEAIETLDINGLHGRMLCLPPSTGKQREILVVYDRYSTLERWWGLAQELQRYGRVTMPDLPGFGGMKSFYKMGEKPSLDRLADYLATFIKFRFRRKRLTMIGLGFGFAVVTRMLQRYPALRKKIDIVISLEGYAHWTALTMPKGQRRRRLAATQLGKHRLPGLFYRNVIINPTLLRLGYTLNPKAIGAPAGADPDITKQLTDFRIYTLRRTDTRTAMVTEHEQLLLDNCQARLPMEVWHSSPKELSYIDTNANKEHLQVIFDTVHVVPVKVSLRDQIIVPDKAFARPLLPAAIRKVLAAPIA